MRWLLFLSRVAFICNLFFLVAFSLQMTNWIRNEEISSTVVIIGYALGFIINPLTVLFYLVFLLISRKKLAMLPSWLITANILFLVMQVLYIFYLNDTQHPQG